MGVSKRTTVETFDAELSFHVQSSLEGLTQTVKIAEITKLFQSMHVQFPDGSEIVIEHIALKASEGFHKAKAVARVKIVG